MPTDPDLIDRAKPDPERGDDRVEAVLAVLAGRQSLEEASTRFGVEPDQFRLWLERFLTEGQRGLKREVAAEADIEFVLSLGRALHSYGASSYRLEGALTVVARKLGLQSRFFATPTSLMASFGPQLAEKAHLVRVQPGEINLEKLALLYEVTSRFAQGDLDVAASQAAVARIVAAGPRYGFLVTTGCYALASATAATFFGGDWPEVAVSAVLGLIVGTVVQMGVRSADTARLAEPVAAALAAGLSALAAHTFAPLSPMVTTLAGVITLLPGLSFTSAMSELATHHLASGTARFAGAFVQLIGLGFGVALGSRLGGLWTPAASPPEPTSWGLLPEGGTVAIASLAYAVLLRARPKDMGWILLAGALAYYGARHGSHWLGPELGALAGAFLVAMVSNGVARVLDRSASITLVPGLLMLVPGSIGFRGVLALLQNDVDSGVTAAFRMLLIATALVAGILLANVTLPSRRPL